jgi:hypothetical protein
MSPKVSSKILLKSPFYKGGQTFGLKPMIVQGDDIVSLYQREMREGFK